MDSILKKMFSVAPACVDCQVRPYLGAADDGLHSRHALLPLACSRDVLGMDVGIDGVQELEAQLFNQPGFSVCLQAQQNHKA